MACDTSETIRQLHDGPTIPYSDRICRDLCMEPKWQIRTYTERPQNWQILNLAFGLKL